MTERDVTSNCRGCLLGDPDPEVHHQAVYFRLHLARHRLATLQELQLDCQADEHLMSIELQPPESGQVMTNQMQPAAEQDMAEAQGHVLPRTRMPPSKQPPMAQKAGKIEDTASGGIAGQFDESMTWGPACHESSIFPRCCC